MNDSIPNVKEIKKEVSAVKGGLESETVLAQKQQEYDALVIKKRIQNKGALHDIWLRLGTCIWACLLLMGWMIFVSVLLWQVSFYPEARLSDQVLITLFTTTTVNIIGLPYVVLKGLFLK